MAVDDTGREGPSSGAEKALRESEERFRLAMDATSDGIWDWNVATGEVYYSPCYTRMLGYEPDEFRARVESWADLIFPEDRERVLAANDACIQGPSPSFEVEYRMRARDGSTKWILGRGKAIGRDARGRALRMVGTHVDVTELRLAAEENARLQGRIQQIQKMESLGTLSGGIAHDMNNVLGAILGLASANLEIQPPDSPAHRSFETIATAAARGGEMVRRLLAFARQGRAEERELDLNGIVQDEVRILERTTMANVRLEQDLDPALRRMRGDASALAHAIMNICVNAVDAMSERGTLTLSTCNVDSEWIELAVRDTGTGMAREVLDRAMEPFFTTKELGKGTGLGLAMVYSAVQAHRGQIDIQSAPGQGTRVRLRFPACEPEAAAPAAGFPQPAPRRKGRVLLVDDDDLVRSATGTLLEALGHGVTAFAAGEEALAAVAEGFAPDLVILDMNMPGLGGGGTLPRLRALLPRVPVLLSSGRTDRAALDLSQAHPFVSLLPKPFGIKDLRQSLAQLGLG